jgi:hypothetical protein
MPQRTRSRIQGAWWSALTLLGLAACGDSGSDAPTYQPGNAGDGDGVDQVCDITEQACQQAVLEATLDARGGELRLPTIRVQTPEQFVAELTAAAKPEDLAPPDAEWTRALSYFDLMPSRWSTDDDLDQLAEGLAAAYFHDGDFIVVLDHGGSMASPESVFTLSHELVHAMQDAEYDLSAINDQFVEASTDEYLGMLGLVEGEAVLYSMLATFEDPPSSRAQWDSFFDVYIAAVQDEALTGPSPYASASLIFPYAQGARFVVDAYLDGGADAVDALYDHVPDSTRQMLAGPGATEPDAGWTEALGQVVDSQLPEGFSVIAQDELGAWLFEVFLDRSEVLASAPLGALDLHGDVFAAFSDGTDVVGLWALRLPPARVDAALDAFAGLGSGYHAELRGTEDVLLFGAAAGVDLVQFAGDFQWPPPSPSGAEVNAARLPPRLRSLRATGALR